MVRLGTRVSNMLLAGSVRVTYNSWVIAWIRVMNHYELYTRVAYVGQ